MTSTQTPVTAPNPPRRWAIATAYAGGGLLAVVPVLVELVMGDFFLLLPVGLLLSLVAPFGLAVRRRRAFPAFVGALVIALASEVLEQAVFPATVPWLADVVPPVAFVVTGIALLAVARDASRERHGLTSAAGQRLAVG
jgi:hypothetical protein